MSRTRVMLHRNTRKTRSQKVAHIVYMRLQMESDINISPRFAKTHNDKSYIFGCSSKEQLRAYFDGTFKPLFAEGFRIKRYVVPDEEVVNMSTQVAFPVKYHKLKTVKAVKKRLLQSG